MKHYDDWCCWLEQERRVIVLKWTNPIYTLTAFFSQSIVSPKCELKLNQITLPVSINHNPFPHDKECQKGSGIEFKDVEQSPSRIS